MRCASDHRNYGCGRNYTPTPRKQRERPRSIKQPARLQLKHPVLPRVAAAAVATAAVRVVVVAAAAVRVVAAVVALGAAVVARRVHRVLVVPMVPASWVPRDGARALRRILALVRVLGVARQTRPDQRREPGGLPGRHFAVDVEVALPW